MLLGIALLIFGIGLMLLFTNTPSSLFGVGLIASIVGLLAVLYGFFKKSSD